MREAPRLRRLRSDYRALQLLDQDSSILSFDVGRCAPADAPDFYVVQFNGLGLYRDQRTREIEATCKHRVEIRLTAAYPRSIPDLRWKTAIFHPNISAGGVICLGGYSTHWTPSLGLDELCHMLWDMVRYQNYDVESPYNREAAEWARQNNEYRLPVDKRPLRDRVGARHKAAPGVTGPAPPIFERIAEPPPIVDAEVLFLERRSDAQPAPPQAEPDIVFLD